MKTPALKPQDASPTQSELRKKEFILDRWYDRYSRNWVVQLRNKNGEEVASNSVYVYTKPEAMAVTVDDFNIYPWYLESVTAQPVNEAKSHLTLPELITGTRTVNKEIAIEADKLPAKVDSWDVEVADLMKYIKFSAVVDAYNPVIVFFDYVKPEKAAPAAVNPWMVSAGLASTVVTDELEATAHPVRVSCTCNEYLAYFARANWTHDAHHGVRPKAVDARDLGYAKADVNPAVIPGVCTHLYVLQKYLRKVNRLK